MFGPSGFRYVIRPSGFRYVISHPVAIPFRN